MRFLLVPLTLLIAGHALAQDESSTFGYGLHAFRLQAAEAIPTTEILNEQFSPFKFSANQKTNTIYGRTPKEVIGEVESFIQQLEADAKRQQEIDALRQAEIDKKSSADLELAQPEPRKTLSIGVKHVDPYNLLLVLNNLGFRPPDVAISAGPLGNTLLARGPAASLEEVAKFVDQLDQPGKNSRSKRELEVLIEERKAELQGLARKLGNSHPQVIQSLSDLRILEAQHAAGTPADRITTVSGNVITTTKPDSATSKEAVKYKQAEREAARLANQLRREQAAGRAPKEQINRLREQLRQKVSEAFEIRQQMKRRQLDEAAEQLETVRKRLDARQAMASKIIDRRVEELTGDDLSWSSRMTEATAGKIDELAKQIKGDVNIQFNQETGTIILRGKKDDVERVKDVIESIEKPDGNKPQR